MSSHNMSRVEVTNNNPYVNWEEYQEPPIFKLYQAHTHNKSSVVLELELSINCNFLLSIINIDMHLMSDSLSLN